LISRERLQKAELKITINDRKLTYGDNPISFGESDLTIEGLVSSDKGKTLNELGITYTFKCDYDNTSDDHTKYGAGTYEITLDVVNNSRNYNSVVIHNGTLTVNQKVITVTAEDKEVTFGDAVPEYTWTSSGYVRGEDASILAASDSSKDLVTFTCEYKPGTPSGTYAITPVTTNMTTTSVDKAGTGSNYTFKAADGKLTVNLKELDLSGIWAADRMYNGTVNADVRVNPNSDGSGSTITSSDLVFTTENGNVKVTKNSDSSITVM